MQKSEGKVPFTQENGMKCICGQCPVQEGSKCVTDKMDEVVKMRGNNPNKSVKMPKPEDMPLLYCSTGTASCKDLKFKQMCICDSCPIWAEYALPSADPTTYYCKSGKAK